MKLRIDKVQETPSTGCFKVYQDGYIVRLFSYDSESENTDLYSEEVNRKKAIDYAEQLKFIALQPIETIYNEEI